MADIVLTGRQILDRWGMLPFELVKIILDGGIIAVDPLSGEKHDRESDNCFFCKRDMKHYSPCHERKAYLAWNNVEGTCINKMRAEYRNKRLGELKFFVRDVEGYEQEHGLATASDRPKGEGAAEPVVQQHDDVLCNSNCSWISGKEVMEGLGLLPVDLAIMSFLFQIDVTCPRRGTIYNPYAQFVTAKWYEQNNVILKMYEAIPDKDWDAYLQDVVDKTAKDLPPNIREEIFDFWVDGASSFMFSREGVERAEKVYVNAGLREPFFTRNELGQFLQTPQNIPDNPLDCGKNTLPLPEHDFKTAKAYAEHFRGIRVPAGQIMLEIERQWGLKKYEAAAVALGDAVPEKGTPEARSYGERYRYHTGLLKQ